MTVDDIMALAARVYSVFNDTPQWKLRAAIEQAIADATLAERERCAKCCDPRDDMAYSSQYLASLRDRPAMQSHPPATWVDFESRARFTWLDWRQAFLDKFAELQFARQLQAKAIPTTT